MTWLLIGLVAFLAFANGANDNGKGVATLVGFGAARALPALACATIATAIGGVISFYLGQKMLDGFRGQWLFEKAIVLDQHFYVAVLIGACGWVCIANGTGMPVSTTHAIIGALCGSGLVSFGHATFQWPMLGQKFAVPLAVSPVLSLALVYVVAKPIRWAVFTWAGRRQYVREEVRVEAFAAVGGAESYLQETEVTESIVPTSPTANAVHWLSCGLISMARGLNDTPKIAGLSILALAGTAHGTKIAFIVVVVAMAGGGLVMGRKVLETLSKKLTPLPLAESLTASLITAALVGLASWVSLPVSTTQVATGSIIGAGLRSNPAGVKWTKVGEIALSWIITLPVAAVIAGAARFILR